MPAVLDLGGAQEETTEDSSFVYRNLLPIPKWLGKPTRCMIYEEFVIFVNIPSQNE
jgi:hypothetical protein